MFSDIDLRELTDLTTPDQCFLSLYLEDPKSIEKMSQTLQMGEAEKDERQHEAVFRQREYILQADPNLELNLLER